MPRHTRAGCAALLSLQVRARVDRQLAVVWLRTGAATAFAHHGCIRTPTHRPLLVLVYTSYCCCIRLCSVRFLLVLANNYGTGKQKTKQALPFVVLKPTQGSGFSRSVQQKRKKCAFRTYNVTAAASPRLTGHGSPPNLESVCSTKLRVLAAKFEGRKWSVSRGLAWDVGA